MIICRRKSNLWLLVWRPLAFWRIYWPALLVMLVGGLLDGVTTLHILHKYGPGEDWHPAMQLVAWVLGAPFGVPLGIVVKMGFAVFAAATFRRWCRVLLIVFGILSALGALYNCYRYELL